jgi:hypothetical protein
MLRTAKKFQIAYKMAKENQSFHNFQSGIDIRELNGTDMGCIIRLSNACINILNHMGDEMRKNLTEKVIRSNSNISLIVSCAE